MSPDKFFIQFLFVLLIVSSATAQQKNVAQLYKVTLYKIYLSEASKNVSALYGSIGIQIQVKRDGNLETLPNEQLTTTRFWSVRKEEAKKLSSGTSGSIVDPTGIRFHYNGSLEVSEWRSFYISESEYTNNAKINIQANLGSVNTLNTQTFPWKQRNLFIKDMQLGTAYLFIQKATENSNNKIAITFKIEKIN
ncbi:hypothetical protein IMCC3317_10140 [Kordia antarctica]|uniref:Uncharacterized protein n=1 Tax=Kordia antarctica TaxID=1218801 RepID=A0A7L4ZG20_9FLAO|nr:hypothetical protein [Kordia antarctica]QHI35668.1 hypothetical protein IMCC3317_10140 [Kordia antarctica]